MVLCILSNVTKLAQVSPKFPFLCSAADGEFMGLEQLAWLTAKHSQSVTKKMSARSEKNIREKRHKAQRQIK